MRPEVGPAECIWDPPFCQKGRSYVLFEIVMAISYRISCVLIMLSVTFTCSLPSIVCSNQQEGGLLPAKFGKRFTDVSRISA